MSTKPTQPAAEPETPAPKTVEQVNAELTTANEKLAAASETLGKQEIELADLREKLSAKPGKASTITDAQLEHILASGNSNSEKAAAIQKILGA